MNRKETGGDGWSRRSLLRSAGAAGAGALVGGFATGTAAAADVRCPRSREHWAVTEWPDTIPDPLRIGGYFATPEEWRTFLRTYPYGDRAHALAQRLVATVVNFHYRMPSDPDCTQRPLEALDGRTVTDVKGEAYRWLNYSRFGTDRAQRSWMVDVEGEPVDGEPLMAALEQFNAGGFEALDCGCTDGAVDRSVPDPIPHGPGRIEPNRASERRGPVR